MPHTLHLQVLTPRGSILDQQVSEVVAPGVAGEFGVLPGHRALLAALQPGALRYRQDGVLRHTEIGAGVARVGPQQVLVLTEKSST